ncbi:hypothetical protein [[Phormidium] sp. ETS-05]|uniref:hypothetical protein n=1 Tax=[Phormidium] sp. ETS-05 TaxID=222819 RepID=UPI0018EEFD47|nr:hypothetical protein [[Phormidium] sp. ETS-05]
MFNYNDDIDVDDDADDMDEADWLMAAASNPVFDFLKDAEDIYTLADGQPFND